MKIYPTTDQPIWGQAASWQGIENWQTTLQFDSDRHVVQEVVPAFTHLRAELHLRGDRGEYLLDFPGSKRVIALRDAEMRLDVSQLMTTGKHLYHIHADNDFRATVTVRAHRPLVQAIDEGYVIDWQTLPAGERQQMNGDRAAHRVGQWARWIKVLPGDSRYTILLDDQIILEEARFHTPFPEYHVDFSGKDYSDSHWPLVALPHAWDSLDAEGYAWYRLRFGVPESWHNKKIVVRIEEPDAEMLVYVDGHTVGYHQPNGRPLQFDISQFIISGSNNVLTLRVSQNLGSTYVVNPLVIAAVRQYGVSCAGRLYPFEEDALQVGFCTDTFQAVGFGPESHLLYRPPEIRLRELQTDEQPVSVRMLADERDACLYFDIHATAETSLWLHLQLDKQGLGMETWHIETVSDDTLKLMDNENPDAAIWFHLPCLQRWIVADTWDGASHPVDSPLKATTSKCHLLLQFQGSSTLIVARQPAFDTDYERALVRWQTAVYGIARPLQMDDVQAAAWRSYKQTVLFNARNVPDDRAHGLLAAFDKPVFHVYWMRDCAISTPGALYTGGEAQRTAFENVGPTLDRYVEVPECIGINPNGTTREGSFSDGPALGVGAQGYAWALLGKDWLRQHYGSAEKQLAYLIDRDAADGDALDGIIRSSQGDWQDVGSMRRLWRVGAVFFVNVIYLRALRIAAAMATELGYHIDAQRWQNLRDSGIDMLNRPIERGGLWLPEHGYYADWVQVDGKKTWVFPRDIDNVTIFSAFSTTAHGMALAEGVIPPERVERICEVIERFNLLDPFPAPSKYPFYDVLAETGDSAAIAESIRLSNPWHLREFFPDLPEWLTYDMVLPWKGWPGNHAWGGRWMVAGAWLALGFWRAGKTELARQAQENLARALLRARHPGRCEETESYSAVSREETGSHVDPAGYYQLWSGAVPLQSLVEGAYGVLPTKDGAEVDLRHYAVGDGIERVPIRGGFISSRRNSETTFTLHLATVQSGQLRVKLNVSAISVTGGQLLGRDDGGLFLIAFKPSADVQITLENDEK